MKCLIETYKFPYLKPVLGKGFKATPNSNPYRRKFKMRVVVTGDLKVETCFMVALIAFHKICGCHLHHKSYGSSALHTAICVGHLFQNQTLLESLLRHVVKE